jgi:hypothetical protein
MNLYIQTENGQPINHPAFEDNLIQAFGEVPAHWAPFNRIHQPAELIPSPFFTANITYGLADDGVTWEDKWVAIEMTQEEKDALIVTTQENPPLGGNVTLDVTTLRWAPNTEKPNDGKEYYWNYMEGNWEEFTPFTPPPVVPDTNVV